MKNFKFGSIERFALHAAFAIVTTSYCYGGIQKVNDLIDEVIYDEYAVKMSFDVHVSNRINDPNLPKKYQWIKNSRYRDTIYKVFYDAIIDRSAKNIEKEDDIYVFKGTDYRKYTRSEWNAVLLYNLFKSEFKTEARKQYFINKQAEEEFDNKLDELELDEQRKEGLNAIATGVKLFEPKKVENYYKIFDVVSLSNSKISDLLNELANRIEAKYSLKCGTLNSSINDIKHYFEALDIQKWINSYKLYKKLKSINIRNVRKEKLDDIMKRVLGIHIEDILSNDYTIGYKLYTSDMIYMNTDNLDTRYRGKKVKLRLILKRQDNEHIKRSMDVMFKCSYKNNAKTDMYAVYRIVPNEYMLIDSLPKQCLVERFDNNLSKETYKEPYTEQYENKQESETETNIEEHDKIWADFKTKLDKELTPIYEQINKTGLTYHEAVCDKTQSREGPYHNTICKHAEAIAPADKQKQKQIQKELFNKLYKAKYSQFETYRRYRLGSNVAPNLGSYEDSNKHNKRKDTNKEKSKKIENLKGKLQGQHQMTVTTKLISNKATTNKNKKQLN